MDSLNTQLAVLSKLLDATEMRHRVIAQNVANVNTPGYRRHEVLFEDTLADALGSQKGTLGSLKPRIVEAPGDIGRADGNTVDIDGEMGRLSKNTVLYQVFSQVLAGTISTMRMAITGKQS